MSAIQQRFGVPEPLVSTYSNEYRAIGAEGRTTGMYFKSARVIPPRASLAFEPRRTAPDQVVQEFANRRQVLTEQ